MGDFLLAVLDEMAGARSVGLEFRLDPARAAGAAHGVNAEVCVLRLVAEYLNVGVLKFGMAKVLAGLPENSPNASEEKSKDPEMSI